jgi:hypothetical protein
LNNHVIRFYGEGLELAIRPPPGQTNLTMGACAYHADGIAVVHLVGAGSERCSGRVGISARPI